MTPVRGGASASADARSVTPRASASDRDALDLDLGAARQPAHRNRGARRAVGPKALAVDLVHGGEVREIREEHRRLRHPIEARSRLDQDRGEVVEDATGLRADIITPGELTAH